MKTAWTFPMAALSLCVWGAAQAPAQEPQVYTGNLAESRLEHVPNRVVVGFDAAVSDAEATRIVAGLRQGAELGQRGLGNAFRLLDVPPDRLWQVVEALRRQPGVRFAHPDWIARALEAPNDPLYAYQWNLSSPDPNAGSIRVEGAWAVNPGGTPSVSVAVIDTGIAYENYLSFCRAPDLAGASFVPGWDFVSGDAHPNDDDSHGTHVAGTIAQTTNNALGVAGIAYGVSLMPVKVLDATGSGTISAIANGIRWATDHGADVINLSLGTSASPIFLTALQDAVQYAAANGVVLVAASGNAAAATPMYPAAYPEVIAVGATKYDTSLASYSNRGNELCAPGGTSTGEDMNGDGQPDMILQNTFDPNTGNACAMGYWLFAGTSMASPHVAAVAALLLSEDPTLTAAQVRQVLRDTADADVDVACGYGLLDAEAALAAVAAGDRPPTVSLVQPANGAVVQGSLTVRISASDADDPAGSLGVEWALDGGAWSPAAWNAATGFYEASWDTTSVAEDSQHTLQGRATDSQSQTTESATVSVRVNNDNQAPVAAFTYTCAHNVCDFNASASTDPDSAIVAYRWAFGDGLAGNGQTIRHTFAATGTYTVTLTVEDDLGATDETAQPVTIDSVVNTMHVGDLDAIGRRISGNFWQATVTIRMRDTANSPVPSARVSGLFDDGSTVFQCTTNTTGACNVVGYQYFRRCLTFTVANVTHATLQYRPLENTDPDGDSNGTRITVCRP